MATTCASTIISATPASLYIDGVTSTANAAVGATVTVSGFVKNSGGTASAGGHVVGLKVDGVVYTGTVTVPAVPAGGTSSQISFNYVVAAAQAGKTVSNCLYPVNF